MRAKSTGEGVNVLNAKNRFTTYERARRKELPLSREKTEAGRLLTEES